MTRADYTLLSHALRLTQRQLAGAALHDEMADSRLMVQIGADAERIVRLQDRVSAIRNLLPACHDPLGFRAMQSSWMRRRGDVLAAARADASRTGDDDKFIRMHKLYNAHVKFGRMR